MSSPTIDKKVLAAARVEVAALLRISAVHGYNEGIDNHYSLALDGTTTSSCSIGMARTGRR